MSSVYAFYYYYFSFHSLEKRIPTESGYVGSHIFAIAVEPLKYPLQGRALFDFGHLKVIFINWL